MNKLLIDSLSNSIESAKAYLEQIECVLDRARCSGEQLGVATWEDAAKIAQATYDFKEIGRRFAEVKIKGEKTYFFDDEWAAKNEDHTEAD